MANTENTTTGSTVKADANDGKKRVNFLVDAEVYEKTFGGERWDLRLDNAAYLEFVLGERVKNSVK